MSRVRLPLSLKKNMKSWFNPDNPVDPDLRELLIIVLVGLGIGIIGQIIYETITDQGKDSEIKK